MNYIVAPGLTDITQVSAEDIINAVCDYYGVSIGAIKYGGRKRSISEPRQVLMYLLTKHGMQCTKIAKMLGNYHYSTVISNVEKIEGLIDIKDDKILEAIKRIKESI
jgi:chromosomal replication initiation ATPase DnaA